MKIRHKGITHDVTTDAPFIGARINAIRCHHNCPGCFNQELQNQEYCTEDIDAIIAQVKDNSLNRGIILGGLEWTEQPEEMYQLVVESLQSDLKVILYTHLTEAEFSVRFTNMCHLPIWIKFGEYKRDATEYYDEIHDVLLASPNQRIKYMG